MKASIVGLSGRGRPSGGIVPPRSFRATFSMTAALRATSVRSTPASTSSPLFIRSL